LPRHQIQLAKIAIVPHHEKFRKKKRQKPRIYPRKNFSRVNFIFFTRFLSEKVGFWRFFYNLEKFSPDKLHILARTLPFFVFFLKFLKRRDLT